MKTKPIIRNFLTRAAMTLGGRQAVTLAGVMTRRFTVMITLLLMTAAAWAVKPTTNLDVCRGEAYSIYVRGWALDKDAPGWGLNVEVYVYSDAACKNQYAYKKLSTGYARPDVVTAHSLPSGSKPGFEGRIPITDPGTYYVKVYAIDIDNEGENITNSSTEMSNSFNPVTVTTLTTISSAADWNTFVTVIKSGEDFAGKTLTLTADIPTAEEIAAGTTAVTTITSEEKAFCGTFDGQGHTINVDLNTSGNTATGLFSYVKGATIKDLTVTGTINNSGLYAGGLVGTAKGATIQNCTLAATINSSGNEIGAFVGGCSQIDADTPGNLTLQDCIFSGSIHITGSYGDSKSAGLVSVWNNTSLTISNCLVKGSFSSERSGAQFYPIAFKTADATVTANVSDAYYLNTLPVTTSGENFIPGAKGKAVSTTETEEYNIPVTAADGNTYYQSLQLLPYTYGFENDDLADEGWTSVDCHPKSTGIFGVICNHTGDLGFHIWKYDKNQYLISPEINSAGKDITMYFYYKITGTGLSFQVGYSTTTNDVHTEGVFIWLDEISGKCDWTKCEKDLPANTKYVAIKAIQSNKDGYIALDDFYFKKSQYKQPANLSISDKSSHSVTLTWETPTTDCTILGYAYQIKKSADPWGTDTEGLDPTLTSVELDNLLPCTSYDFRMKTLYEDGESEYETITTHTFLGIPYSYDFENGDLAAEGWSTVDCFQSEPIPLSGNYRFFIDYDPLATQYHDQYLISPGIDSRGKGYKLSFYYQIFQNRDISFQVGYSTTTNAISDFTIWDEKITGQCDWTLFEKVIPPDVKYIAIKGIIKEHASIGFDNFGFDVITPEQLKASDINGQSATLTWSIPDDDGLICYAYQYKKTSDADWSEELTTTSTTVTLTGLADDTSYEFRVAALYDYGKSEYIKVSFITSIIYQAPMNLVVSELTDQSATLTWEAPESSGIPIKGYGYQFRKKGNVDWSTEIPVNNISTTIDGLNNNTQYEVRLRALYEGGHGSRFVTILFTLGSIPVTAETTEMTTVHRVTDDVTINSRIIINGDVTLILDEGKTLNASKGIELSAGNKLTIMGKGTLNATATITWDAGIGAKEVGTLVIEDGIVNATGAYRAAGIGGNELNYSGGTITINGGTVNATGGAEAPGIGGGWSNGYGAYGFCGTITINGGKVTANGNPGIGARDNASAGGSVTLSWTTPRSDRIYASSYGGNVPITCGKGFFNGSEFLSSGEVTDLNKINGKTLVPSSSITELTITADSDTKTYDGKSLTKNSYTHTNLADGDYITNISISGCQTDVGSCDNVPSGAVIKDATGKDVTANYNITYVNGTLEVTPKAVTVKADDKEKGIGHADPTLTATVTGMVEGEEESLISYDIGREAGEAVGTYVITPTGEATQGNYAVTYETGTLTITDEMYIDMTAPTEPTVLDLEEDYISENVLSVTVAAADGQTHSYQWYVNTTDDTTGGTAIDGATSSSYMLPWGIEGLLHGTYYYYCLVTASRSDISKTISVASPMFIVTVTAVYHEPGHYKNPIVITTSAELNQLAQEVNAGNTYEDKYIKLGNDIAYNPDVLDTDHNGDGTPESNYTAIGMYLKDGDLDIQRTFNGHFDGMGYTISGIRLNHNSGENTYYNSYKGLFGYLGSGASISNVTLTDTEITANYYVGGIAGYAWNSSITNCHVTSSVTIHTVMDNAGSHGGIVGENYGTVSHCTSAVNLTIANGKTPGWDYGGIVGCHHKDGEITDNLVLGATVPAARYCSNGAITGNNEGTLCRNYYSGCTVAGKTTNVGSARWLPNVANYEVADVTENDGAVPVPSATISKEGYGTYYISAADVVLPEGMKARIVTANEGDGSLTYETIADGSTSTKTVPAGTAVMLQTEPTDALQTISMTLAAQTDQRDFSATNLLHGSDVAVETSGGGNGAEYYRLSYDTNGKKAGWYWGAADGAAFTSAAHEAWLALPAGAGAGGFLMLPSAGDANGDGKVDAADIVEMVNAMNGNVSTNFNWDNADFDGNHTITDYDINEVVKIIMGE